MNRSSLKRGWTRRDAMMAMAAATVSGTINPAEAARRRQTTQSLNPRPPNILFVMTDDGPRNSYGIYGNCQNIFSVITEEYMGHWLNYKNGSVNDPLCAPGRAATLSGRVGYHHQVWTNDQGWKFIRDLKTFWPQALRQKAGYFTGGYGKLMNQWGNDLGGVNDPDKPKLPGDAFDDYHFIWGNPGYVDYKLSDNGVKKNYGHVDNNDPETTDYLTDRNKYQILAFLDACHAADAERPWAVYWAPNAPHKDGGNAAGPRPAQRHANWNIPINHLSAPNFNWPATPQMPWLQAYQASYPLSTQDILDIDGEYAQAMRTLVAVDEGLRAIMDKLIGYQQLDNTVIFVCTDNSHMYGSFGLTDKGASFEDAVNLLLRVRYPLNGGIVPNGERPQAVSNIDFSATICELAGITPINKVDGVSFASTFLDANAPFREAAPLFHGKEGPGTPLFDGLRFPDRKVILGRNTNPPNQMWAHQLRNGANADEWERNPEQPTPEEILKVQQMVDFYTQPEPQVPGRWRR